MKEGEAKGQGLLRVMVCVRAGGAQERHQKQSHESQSDHCMCSRFGLSLVSYTAYTEDRL